MGGVRVGCRKFMLEKVYVFFSAPYFWGSGVGVRESAMKERGEEHAPPPGRDRTFFFAQRD